MSALLACPFCRALFQRGEGSTCPECGVRLQPLHQLPPSLEQLAEDALAGELVAPEDRPLPFTHVGRARGPLVMLGALGLVAFALPWVAITSPHAETLSGLDLARRGASWLWGGAAGWFVLVALVLSRRTVRQMRGVRAIVTVFAAMTAVEVAMLLAVPPRENRLVHVEYAYGYGLYLSALLSALGIGFGARFGGSAVDLRDVASIPGAPGGDQAPPGVELH